MCQAPPRGLKNPLPLRARQPRSACKAGADSIFRAELSFYSSLPNNHSALNKEKGGAGKLKTGTRVIFFPGGRPLGRPCGCQRAREGHAREEMKTLLGRGDSI